MSCIFCGNNNHVSQNCDFYFSDEERLQILNLRNRCQNCLTILDEYIYYSSYKYARQRSTACDEFVGYCSNKITSLNYCTNCEFNEKCFICFSTDHHTVFCPDRFTAMKLFSPNIDIDLMTRFLKLLTDEEKYLICLTSPDIFSFTKYKPLKVFYRKSVSASDIKYLPPHCNIFVADSAYIEANSFGYDFYIPGSIGLSNLKDTTFCIRHLEIQQSSILSRELLQLLSPKTKILKCTKVQFAGKLTFNNILKTAPNLEEIDIHQTNVKIENSWPDDLLQLNRATKLKHVHLKLSTTFEYRNFTNFYSYFRSFPDFDFNIESLVTLMKEKCGNVSISIMLPLITRSGKYFGKRSKFSCHFVPCISNSAFLTIYNIDENFNVLNHKKFGLKNI